MCERFDTLNHDSDGRGGCARFWAAADELMRGLHKFQPKATKALLKPDGSTCCTEDRLPRRFLSCWVRNPRPTGCPHFTYARGLFKSLKKVDILRAAWYDLAQEREHWRKLIAKQFTEKL